MGIATVVISRGMVLIMVEGFMIACHEKPQDSPCKCRAGSNHLENTKKQTSRFQIILKGSFKVEPRGRGKAFTKASFSNSEHAKASQ